MIRLSQDNRQLTIDTPLGKDVLFIQSLEGREAMSRLYQYEAVVLSEDEAIEGSKIVGQLVSVVYHSEDGRQRNITGYVSRFEYLQQVEEPAKLTSYQLTLVPWLWFLRHNKDCRMFQEMNAPDIIQKIFNDLGFTDYQLSINETYAEREYCVQYNESDFDFVSRLMEEEGLFYYFKHEGGNHKLVISDSTSGYYDSGETEVSYTPIGQSHFQQLASWRHVYEFRPGNVAQKDFNFKKPTDGLKTEEKSVVDYDVSSKLEVYEYPGLYEQGSNGNRLTKVRREALDAEHDYAMGSGYYLMFSPGGKFKMSDHSRASEVGKNHVLVEVYTEIKSNLSFENDGAVDFVNQFRCIPAETVFRPTRRTVKPVVEGPQTAIVVTDGQQEIIVDDHARVKVQFHWDRYGEKNMKSSCWIRVSQVHAGNGWGMIDIPRRDEEVIVSFLDGDPDRPIITGRVYNGDNPPPFGLKGAGSNSKNKTRRGNTTKSYEASGYNEMTMDDTAGKEEIRIHGQYDMNTTVQHDQTVTVNNNRTKTIAVDESNTIGKNRVTKVGKDHTETVDQNQTITVAKNQTTTVGQNQTNTIGANQTNTIAANQTTAVGGAMSLSVGSAMSVNVSSAKMENVALAASESVGAAKAVNVGAALSTTVGMNNAEQVGNHKKTVVGGDNDLTVAGKSVEKAREITIAAGMKVTIQAGATLELQCGASSIQLTPAMITIKGPLVKINC